MAVQSAQILSLKDYIKKNKRNPKAPIEQMLASLYDEAGDDDATLGFLCFHFADYYYFMRPDQDKFQHYIKLAIRHLLRSGDRRLLGPAYNLVAVDAHNGGNYTIALHYYMTALNIGRENQQFALCAAIGANVGRIMTELGNYDLAEIYLSDSLDLMEQGGRSIEDVRNTMTIAYLRGLNFMFLKKKKEARNMLAVISDLLKEYRESASVQALYPAYLFLQGNIEASTNKAAKLDAIIEDLVSRLKEEPALFDYMEDIVYLCEPLLKRGAFDYVGKILKIVERDILRSGILRMERLFYELKLGYDEAAGHPGKALKDMQHINDCFARQDEELSAYSLRAIELSSVMVELRSQQAETQQENKLLQEEADADPLTGLPNRYALNDHLDQAIERARESGTKIAVGFLDVDYFKEYNDLYGHQAGDLCLHAVAGALRRLSARYPVFCARYGGDEFVIIMEDADEQKVEEISRALEEDIASCKIPHKGSKTSPYVTVAQGLYTATPKEYTKMWDYLAEADRALYRVKMAR